MNVDLLVWNLDKIRACEPAPQKPRAQKSRAWQPSQADDVVEAPVSVPPTAALAASDVVDKNLPEIERAEELCCRLTKLHYLLSDNMNCSLSVQHLAGVHLSGFGTDEMDMLLRTCNNMEVWHRTLCRMESSDRRDNCPSICKHVKRSSEFQRLAVLRCHQLRIHAETVRRPPELEEEDKNLKLEPLDQQFPDAPRTQQAFPLSTRLISIFSRGAKKALPDDEAGLQMENARRLQYLLCQSLFYLYKSPWLRDMWDLDNIKIARGNRGYNFNKAYYPYPLGRNPPATLPPNSVEDLQDDTEIETITSKLGLLLLQIEFQRKFPLDAANPDPALTLDQQFKRYQKNLDDSLKGVIEACLNFRCRVDDMCHPKLLSKDLKFRMIVYTDILEPLWLFLTGHWSSVAAGINNCAVRGNLSRQSAMETATPVPESAPEQSKSWGEIRDPATEPGSTGSTGAIGGTMLKRFVCLILLGWFTALDNFNSFLTADPDDTDLDYEQHRVKIVVIDSGLEENRRNEVHIAAYRNFITDPYPPSEDRPSHGTASADLILKAYGRAQLYIAKVFRGDEADDNTPRYMAEAIKWAIEISADIINISAGFWSPCPTELTKAVADAASGGSRHEILIIAAAGNKTTNQPVCAPANVIKHVICMFSCSEGFVQSKKFNPKWRQNADNFTMLGEDVSLGYGPPLEGTSVSTALATGVVGKLLDFARQKSIKSIMGAEIAAKLRTNAGMSAVLKEMAKENLDGKYECIAPWDILPFEPRNSPSTPSAMDKTGVRGRISSRIAEILRPLPCVSYDPEIVEESIQADGG
ncbi:hypothetical protein F5883DRAFT_436939 [Diaporthe sp. PMI_573]|nr:hypothetical protein F5883DRAFT_436939 [Diaporthaceae sp. PMI_573]